MFKVTDKGTNRRMDTQIIRTMHFEYVSRSTVDGLFKGKMVRQHFHLVTS